MFVSLAICVYGNSGGLKTTEECGRVLILHLAHLIFVDAIKAMLDTVKVNVQIYEASDTTNILDTKLY